ncbi:VOC family protein [Oleomonas cavernae]|uniref:VOC family protein n=1 Tax=Oleomonas cavernae TaxID=2320859 RepID=A0A418WI28_9PROT|nr:VOC family protein [Oleomonas cavernae]RJF89681.1 VOC family protein [Oleomonas cavernae]
MIGYVTLGVVDFDQGVAFYDALMGILGQPRYYFSAEYGWASWGTETAPRLFICKPFDGQPASVGNGTMVSLNAASRAQVDAIHAAAMANGGHDEGGPGIREHYGPTFYAAYFRDPTGNKLNAVYNGPG